MNRTIRTFNISLDIFFIFLLFLINLKAKTPEKYFIELPHSFYLNLTSQGQKPLELWHPRLILSQIMENGEKIRGYGEKRSGILKEKAYKSSTSFLEISSEIEPKIKSNKMSCSCKFTPDFAGSEPKEEKENSANFIEKKDETMLIQTNTNSEEKNKKNTENFKENQNYEEKIERNQKKTEKNPEKTERNQEKVERNPEKNDASHENNEDKKDIDKKELLEMYEKLEKLLKLEEENLNKKSSNSEEKHQEKPQDEHFLIQANTKQKAFVPESRGFFPQKPKPVFINAQQQQIQQNQQNPYVIQPINSNFAQEFQRQVPQPIAYDYEDYNYYDPNLLQGNNNNVRYVTIQQQQPKYVVIPAQQRPQQQVVYVNNEGEILGY